jgi:hypothetical protein
MNGVENVMSKSNIENLVIGETSKTIIRRYEVALKEISKNRGLFNFLENNDWATEEDYFSMVAQIALDDGYKIKLDALHAVTRDINDKMDGYKINEDMSSKEILEIALKMKQDVLDGYYDDSQMLELIEKNLNVIEDIEDEYGENDELIASWGFMFMCGVNIRKELEK